MLPLNLDNTYQMFEYSCQEGNYAMANALSFGRKRDAEAAAAKTSVQEGREEGERWRGRPASPNGPWVNLRQLLMLSCIFPVDVFLARGRCLAGDSSMLSLIPQIAA